MHEWALAESIIFAVNEEVARKNLLEITKVEVQIGELQQIDLEIFQGALESVLPMSRLSLDMSKIVIEIEDCVLSCRICAHQWPYRETIQKLSEDDVESSHFIPEVAHVYIRCPQCGSPDFDIAAGRGVKISSIWGLI